MSVQVDMITKILILKSKYVARRRYVHVRARRRANNHIGSIGIGGLVNLSSKQFDQRLPPLTIFIFLVLIQLVTLLLFSKKKFSQTFPWVIYMLKGIGAW